MTDTLRTYPPARTYPGIDWLDQHMYCPECKCNKSGSAYEANARTEACDKYVCDCHLRGLVIP